MTYNTTSTSLHSGTDNGAQRSEATLRSRLAAGEVALGAWCAIPSALSAEALARGPVDWVLIDMQHGCMDYETTVEMIRAVDLAGVPVIVRVPWNEPSIIGRVLDAGALGILLPMIETAADARRAVDACLYPPAGRRSLGPIRVGIRDGLNYFAGANERIIVIPMIETSQALEAVDEIAAVPGVTALFLGAWDLSLALGLAPTENDGNPIFDSAVAKIISATQRFGLAAAMLSNVERAPLRLKQGFRMLAVFTDIACLSSSVVADVQIVRKSIVAK